MDVHHVFGSHRCRIGAGRRTNRGRMVFYCSLMVENRGSVIFYCGSMIKNCCGMIPNRSGVVDTEQPFSLALGGDALVLGDDPGSLGKSRLPVSRDERYIYFQDGRIDRYATRTGMCYRCHIRFIILINNPTQIAIYVVVPGDIRIDP